MKTKNYVREDIVRGRLCKIVDMTDSERLEDSQAAERGAGQLDTYCCWSDRRLALTLLSSEQQTKVPR